MMVLNNGRIGKWRKSDILFLVGIGLIVYGAARLRLDLLVAGAGIAGIPIAQRQDEK